MSSEGDGEECGGRPAEDQSDRVGEERAGPAEIRFYIAVAEELTVGLGCERAGEEDSEEKKYDPANLAGESGLGRSSVPVRARAL